MLRPGSGSTFLVGLETRPSLSLTFEALPFRAIVDLIMLNKVSKNNLPHWDIKTIYHGSGKRKWGQLSSVEKLRMFISKLFNVLLKGKLSLEWFILHKNLTYTNFSGHRISLKRGLPVCMNMNSDTHWIACYVCHCNCIILWESCKIVVFIRTKK